jgi:hypothetical protein
VPPVLQPLRDLVENESFRDGLIVGAILACVCVGCAFAFGTLAAHKFGRTRTLPIAGLALCLGSYVALRRASVPIYRPALLLSGLGALALAGFISRRWPSLARILAVLPGAVLVSAAIRGDTFARAFALPFIVFAAAAAVEWADWSPVSSAGPAMLTATVLGVYVSTPDTEHAVVVLGVAVWIGLTGWPSGATAVGSAGAPAVVGLIAWLAGTDGVARPGAVVGASACVGVFVIVPVLRRIGVSLDLERSRLSLPVGWVCLVVHVAVVALCSRVAGLESSAVAAGTIAFVVFVGSMVTVRGLLRE